MLSHLAISERDILDILNDESSPTPEIESNIRDEELDVSYNLSTMTICGRLGGTVDIQRVIQGVPIQPYWAIREGILRAEGYIEGKPYSRGISRRYIEKRKVEPKPFRNSASLYCRLFDEETGIAKEPSIKIFRNGGIQATGIRTPNQANRLVKFVSDTLRSLDGAFIENDEPNYISVSMMNSDITLPYMINRDALQRLLREEGVLSTFETTSYQGVNTKYYWNHEKHENGEHQSGICECEHKCESSGKKRTMTNPEMRKNTGCVRITIAPFQTGKIIVTGAKTEQQVSDASKWIVSFIKKHKGEILLGKAPQKKKTHKIPFRGGHTIKI